MILQVQGGRLLVILQTDHAALSGVLAEHWGNGTFACPEPRGAVVVAAAHHDDGWRLWELSPRIDPDTERPYQFTDLPVAEHAGFYRAGVDEVLARDPYAGLLVSMHLAGLYQRRFGTDPGMPLKPLPPRDEGAVREVLWQLGAQQQTLREHLPGQGVPPRFLEDRYVWSNYKLLQVFDRLSLYFCLAPPRDTTLGPAPIDYEGREVQLSLLPVAGNAVTVSPYPFDADPLPVGVRAHVVADRPYADDEDFRTALKAAEVTDLAFELRAG